MTGRRWQLRAFWSSGMERQQPQTFASRRRARRAKAALCADLGINPDNVKIAPLPADGAVAA